MPRPDAVTDEMVAEWDAEMDSNPPEGLPEFMLQMPEIREVYYAGEWLSAELSRVGADEETRQKICFASGQKMVFAPDPWQVVEETVSEYSANGSFDEPGPELAGRLIEENLGVGTTDPPEAE